MKSMRQVVKPARSTLYTIHSDIASFLCAININNSNYNNTLCGSQPTHTVLLYGTTLTVQLSIITINNITFNNRPQLDW